MRVFLNRTMARFVRKTSIADQTICDAARTLIRGGYDADLGGGVYKQRMARTGQGKSGGFRLIVVLRVEQTVFFIYAFAKKDQDNVTLGDLRQLKKLAAAFQKLTDSQIEEEIVQELLTEVKCDGEAISQ